jgi:hypothetical protein
LQRQLAEEGTEEKCFLFVYDLSFYQLDYSSLRVTNQIDASNDPVIIRINAYIIKII